MVDLRAPFRYWGSKVQMAPWICERLPLHDHWIEACAGSAAVTAVKPRSLAETLNDTYGEVVNFFRVLRDADTAARLIDLVAMTPYARDEFRAALAWEGDDPVERAWAFYVRMQMAVVPGRTGWSYGVNGRSSVKANKAGRWASMPDLLRVCGERFAGVQIENLDIFDLLDRYDDPTTLFFVDPPYTDASRPNSTGDMSAYVDDSFDHTRLFDAMSSSSSSFAVTHYPDPQYDAFEWTSTDDFRSHRNIPNKGADAGRDVQIERLYILDRSGRTRPLTLFG